MNTRIDPMVLPRAGIITVAVLLLLALLQAAAPAQTTNAPGRITVHEKGPSRAEAKLSEEIVRQIAARLEADRWVASYQVSAKMSNAVAVLEGKVDNLLARERAEHLARTVPDVSDVQNHIQVAVDYRPDDQIEAHVRSAFARDPLLKSYRMQITSENGYLTLSGTVGSNHKKQVAESLAKAIPGVSKVENELIVDRQAGRSDEDIRAEVLSTLRWDPWLKNPQLEIEVSRGTVTVAGAVRDEAAKARIKQDAEAAGARSVDLSKVRVDPDQFNSEGPLQSQQLTPTGRPKGPTR